MKKNMTLLTKESDLKTNSARTCRLHAKYLIVLNWQGEVEEILRDSNKNLDVIAVLAPVDGKEGLVLEIGLHGTIPYARAVLWEKGWSADSKKKRKRIANISPRKKDKDISPILLRGAWGAIEDILVEDAEGIVKEWKSPHWSFVLRPSSMVFSKSAFKKIHRMRGPRYAVSLEDKDMAAAVLQSERRYRQVDLDKDLMYVKEWLSRFFGKYSLSSYSKKRIKHILSTGGKMGHGFELLAYKNLLPHHYAILMDKVRKGSLGKKKGLTIQQLEAVMDYLNIDMFEVSLWGELLLRDVPMFHQGSLFRIVPSRDGKKAVFFKRNGKIVRRKRRTDIVRFEIIPTSVIEKSKAQLVLESEKAEVQEDIPFPSLGDPLHRVDTDEIPF